MTSLRAASVARTRSAQGGGLIAVIASGIFLAPINSTMIAVALPALMAAFGVGVAGVSWIVTVYLVTMAGLQPVGGKLGDLYGHRRLFLIGCGGLASASVACALAPTFPLLVASRALQAVFAATMAPNGAAIIRHRALPDSRGRAFGWLAAWMTFGAAIGPAVAGLLVHRLGWASIFWVNLPILALVLPLAFRFLPETPRQSSAGFDGGGAILLTLTFTAGVVALARVANGGIGPLIAAGMSILLGLTLYGWERRQSNPMIDFCLFRHPAFAGASAAVMLTNLAMYTTLLLVPLFMAGLQGRGATAIGWVLVVYSGLMSLLSPLGGYLSDRLGPARPVVAGTVLLLAGTGLLLRADAGTSLLALTASLALGATGVGLQMAAQQAAALESAPAEMAGAANGVWATARYLGSIAGAVLLGVLVGDTLDFTEFRNMLYAVGAACCILLPLGTVLRLSGRPIGLLTAKGTPMSEGPRGQPGC